MTAWVATGAVHGRVTELFTVGSGHPGYTGILMAISRTTNANSSMLAWPAMAAGILGPPSLYVALRQFGQARSIAMLAGATFVASDAAILYSTRVKTYAIDALIVLAVVFLLPTITARSWTFAAAIAWVVFAVCVSLFSGFALIAAAFASFLLAVHARADDRRMRLAALGATGVLLFIIYTWERHSSDLASIERSQEPLYDGHLSFSWNPIELSGDLLRHFRRLINTYPGGSHWIQTAVVLAVIAGLLSAALRQPERPRALRAQYLSGLLLLAIIGAYAHRFPFGAGTRAVHSFGDRSSLWLLPVVAVGLAEFLQLLRTAAGRAPGVRVVFDVMIFGAAVAVLLSMVHERAAPYKLSGAKTATRQIEAELRPDDVVLLPGPSTMTFAVETSTGVKLVATPERTIGYVPEFLDDRIIAIGRASRIPAKPEAIRSAVGDANRVVLFIGIPFFGPDTPAISNALAADGFARTETRQVGDTLIEIWERT